MSVVNVTNDTCQPTADIDEEVVSTVVPIFFGLIGITGLIGNALVVLVVISNPQMRSTTNVLIINLSLADLLFVIFCVPFTATDYILAEWPFGDPWCKIVQYLIAVTVHTSIYTLVLMSLDRFLAVVYPIASRTIRTEKNTILAIIILWGWVLLMALPALLFHGVQVSLKLQMFILCIGIYNYVACLYHERKKSSCYKTIVRHNIYFGKFRGFKKQPFFKTGLKY